MEVLSFSEIEAEFTRRVNTMVWCNMATVDGRGRPRSRVMHPIWEGATGWITTHRTSYKGRHLKHNPFVSLAYIQDIMNPVYVDARVEWVDDSQQKLRIWNLYKYTPPPLGFDPGPEYGNPEDEDFGLLKVLPWRIIVVSFPAPSFEEGQRVWRSERR